ncbi:hypothetical protein TYRP_007644 [Tyrophagus putrescentiae]|nr:hypothetical protein TYRP_007644 [Tyrophagus putrescentiae]
MNCQRVFQDFNSSKFVVYTSLLCFFILFALRLDRTVLISWWLVFLPLWVWKSLVILGAFTGVLVWICNPEYRLSESSYTHFKSMLIALSLQLLLLMFELLVCDKLESNRHFWTLAFVPLIFVSLLSIAVAIWALKNERDFEFEFICSLNLLQFIFVPIRLDDFITWSWVVVFVPLWILLCLAIIGVLYALIFAVILFRTPEVSAEQRRASFYSALAYTLIVLPLLVFFVLLSSKLDSVAHLNARNGNSHIGAGITGGDHPNPHLHSADTPPAFTGMIQFYSPHISPHAVASLNPATGSQLSTPLPFFSAASYHFEMDYFSVFVPLYFTLIILICMSFSSKGGNLWWFGMRKDFCSFLLVLCPCLREYANISYNFTLNSWGGSGGHHHQNGQQNERTNLTAVTVTNGTSAGSDYDVQDGKKVPSKLKKVITQQPNAVVLPNSPRLDIPD